MHQDTVKLTTFPAFLKVAGLKVVVFGGGAEAAAKVRLIANTSARIEVHAEDFDSGFAEMAEKLGVALVRTGRTETALEGAVLAFAASGDGETDRRIVSAARAKKIPANAVDQPDFCDFFIPALVNRAPVSVAIGTEGAGPVLAQIIRARVDRMLAPSTGLLARLAAEYRAAAPRMLGSGQARRKFWRRFFEGDVAAHLVMGDISSARRAATRLLHDAGDASGRVWLVGAGPGAEDLITLRAQRLLMQADIIIHDASIADAIVDLGRRDAVRIAAGGPDGRHSCAPEAIAELMIRFAGEGRQIVRLRAGCGARQGDEDGEIAALRRADVAFQTVPGVETGLGALEPEHSGRLVPFMDKRHSSRRPE